MENAEEIFHFLDDFSKRKPKTIPQELNEYLAYVARTGDPVYQWPLVKSLFKEKLLNVITDFYETTPGIEIPPYPNVDQFNYDIMKNSLLERLDSFTSAPFTVQRLCELLTFPRKQYNRIDKFMRAIEKNILVVSTREPGIQRHSETENGEANEPIVNGSDTSDYHVDVEMEDTSRKDSSDQWANEPQPGSSDTNISVDDIEARLKAKENTPMDAQEKKPTEYESVTPPELNVINEINDSENPKEKSPSKSKPAVLDKEEIETDAKLETPASTEKTVCTLVIPEIRVDDAEMTERNLIEQANTENLSKPDTSSSMSEVSETAIDTQAIDESSSDSKYEPKTKLISEMLTSSEESSSSSDNTDGSCSSPKTDEIQDESNQSGASDAPEEPKESVKITKKVSPTKPKVSPTKSKISPTKLKASPTKAKVSPTKTKTSPVKPKASSPKIKTENYTILDVQSKPIEDQAKAADQEEPTVTEENIVIDNKTEDSEPEKE